jgi:hypothetical protein
MWRGDSSTVEATHVTNFTGDFRGEKQRPHLALFCPAEILEDMAGLDRL